VDKKAVSVRQGLETHAMIFIISSINKFLKHARATTFGRWCSPMKREIEEVGAPKVGEWVSAMFVESFW